MVLFKKYLFFTQRMILYLNIAALLSAFARMINFELSYSEKVDENYCIATGFMDQYSSSCFLIAIVSFTVDIFLQAIFSLNTKRVEIIYPLLIFFTPALYCWIPFYDKPIGYGPAGAWCWIRDKNDACEYIKRGTILRFSLFYGPYFLLLPFLLILILITSYILYRRRHTYEALIDPIVVRRRRAIRQEIKILLLYPTLVLVLNIIPLITRIYDIKSRNEKAPKSNDYLFAFWVLNAIIVPLEVAVVPLVYTIDPETRRRITSLAEIRSAMRELCTRSSHGRVSEYPAETIVTSTDSYKQQSTDTAIDDKEPLLKDSHYATYEASM